MYKPNGQLGFALLCVARVARSNRVRYQGDVLFRKGGNCSILGIGLGDGTSVIDCVLWAKSVSMRSAQSMRSSLTQQSDSDDEPE